MSGYQDIFIAIAVQQWEPMVQFYHHVLGKAPTPDIPGSYAEFKAGSLKVGLFLPKEDHQLEFAHPSQSAMSLCLEVENLERSRHIIDTAYDALHQMGYKPLGNHRRYGEIAIASHGRECYAYDPDGNRLILHEGITE